MTAGLRALQSEINLNKWSRGPIGSIAERLDKLPDHAGPCASRPFHISRLGARSVSVDAGPLKLKSGVNSFG
jgi:hypothetical protein